MPKQFSCIIFYLFFVLIGKAQIIFYDGFEKGNINNWTVLNNTNVSVNANDAIANYSLQINNGTEHYKGITHQFQSSTPKEISWYLKPNETIANNYTVIGDSNMQVNNGAIFCYWHGSNSTLNFINQSAYSIKLGTNIWHFIQIKNINFVTHHFDIYIDGIMVNEGFAFRNNLNCFNRIDLYNTNNGPGQWDEIKVGSVKTFNVKLKALLSGPFNASDFLMNDALRIKYLIPLSDPYSFAPYDSVFKKINNTTIAKTHPAILQKQGNDAIVDWVFVELRNKYDSNIVVGTQAALIQRDGDIVQAFDGMSPLQFSLMDDQFFISIKHRNHLGIMSLGAIQMIDGVLSADFTQLDFPLFTLPSPNNNANL